MLAQLKTDLGWLREQVASAVRRGDERASIHAANLIPPGLLSGNPDVYLPYLLLREHAIDRLYDQSVGYWQADLQGLDHLAPEPKGATVFARGGAESRLHLRRRSSSSTRLGPWTIVPPPLQRGQKIAFHSTVSRGLKL
jgi:hypothetical protein